MIKQGLANILMISLIIFLPACSKDNQADEPKDQTSPPTTSVSKPIADKPNADYGKIIFLNECAVCHGEDGKKSMAGMKKDAANLASPKIQKKTDAELKRIIREGKKENPEMAGHPWLTEDKINSLVLFLRTLK